VGEAHTEWACGPSAGGLGGGVRAWWWLVGEGMGEYVQIMLWQAVTLVDLQVPAPS